MEENDEEQLRDRKEIEYESVKYGKQTKTNCIKMNGIRKSEFFVRHVMRHGTFITNIMEGKINGK